MPSKVTARARKFLAEVGYSAKKVQVGVGSELDVTPCLVFDQGIYPGVEAHLFTIADAALWIPIMASSGEIVLCRPPSIDEAMHIPTVEKTRIQSWRRLLRAFMTMSSLLGPYKESLEEGYIPSIMWAHFDAEWFRKIREAPDPQPRPVHEFIHYIDESIRTHIQDLNENGFSTIESCSGLPNEHLDREPYDPYVMFSEKSYEGVTAHLFTLADIAQWIPCCAPHGFDIVIKQEIADDMEAAWTRLLEATKALSALVKEYQELARNPVTSFRRTREQIRKSDSVIRQLLE